MINSAVFIGYPQHFKDICKVYSPLVKEVIYEEKYPLYRKLLTESQEEIIDEYIEKKKKEEEAPTPFQFLMQLSLVEENKKIIEQAFSFFIKEPVTIAPEQSLIIIGNLEEELVNAKTLNDLRVLNEENFFEFQNLCRISFGEEPIKQYDPNMDPRKKRMLALARKRDKVKAKKTDGIDFSTTLAAICCMGIGITPLNIGEISVGAISTLMAFYQNKEKYQQDISALLAGADKKKIQLKYWIRNLDKD